VSDAPIVDTQPRHLSPWMVIGGIALLAVLGAIALAVVAAALAPAASPVPSGLAQAQLADGSVLVLHDMTEVGQLELPEVVESGWKQFFERLFGNSPPNVTFYSSSYGGTSLTLWLARYDGRTGQPLEFDRWSHSVVTTPAGDEVSDSRYASRSTRQTHPHSSTSSTSGVRPLQAIDPGTYSHIVYSNSVPRVRSATGEVDVEVYHADDGQVATFHVPLPGGPTSYPTWTPDPLPANAVDGDLEVTLTSLTAEMHQDTSSEGQLRPRRDVRVDLDVRQQGEASALWNSRQVWLKDALGNESNPYDCTLPPGEAAWKVGVRLFRSDEAAMLQGSDRPTGDAVEDANPWNSPDGTASVRGVFDQRYVIEDLPLPPDGMLPNSIPHKGDPAVIDGVAVSYLGVGGPGKCEYRFQASRSGRGSYSVGEGIETEFDPPNATLTIDNNRRHIALKVEGDTVDHRVVLLLTDQNGVRLKTGWPRQMEEARVWLFDADEWVTAVNVYITVQRARNVEFTVAPPRAVAIE
jgi:hypothetical protein